MLRSVKSRVFGIVFCDVVSVFLLSSKDFQFDSLDILVDFSTHFVCLEQLYESPGGNQVDGLPPASSNSDALGKLAASWPASFAGKGSLWQARAPNPQVRFR